MTEFYRITTTEGEATFPKGTKIYVQMQDSSYAAVPIQFVSRYAGNSKTVFKRSYRTTSLSTIENRLMNCNEGRFATYKEAKLQLFDEHKKENSTIYIPKLSSLLKKGIKDSEEEYISRIHQAIQKDSENPVVESTIKDWLHGTHETAAPKDWNNFRILAQQTGLEEFEQFYQDFLNFHPDNSLEYFPRDNKFFAHKFYKVARTLLGKEAKLRKKKNGNSQQSKPDWNSAKKVNLDNLKEFLRHEFFQEVDELHDAAPILSVTKLESQKSEKKEKTKGISSGVSNGIYVVTNETNGVKLKKKSLEESCKDVVVLERTILSNVQFYLNEKFDSKHTDISMYVELCKLLESKLRHVTFIKNHTCLHPEDYLTCEKASSTIFSEMFETEKGNETLKLPEHSLQRLNEVYQSISPLLPNDIEKFVLARNNYHLLEKQNKTLKGDKLIMKKMKNLQRLMKSLAPQDKQMRIKIGLKSLVSEEIDASARYIAENRIAQHPHFSILKKAYESAPEKFYSESEIREVLVRYELEAFVPNVDMRLLDAFKLSSFLKTTPNLNELLNSPTRIASKIMRTPPFNI